MDIDKKKITAAITAVAAYLQEEAAAAAQAAASEAPAATFREPAGYVRPWAANGRQTMMQVRNLMQLRMFTR